MMFGLGQTDWSYVKDLVISPLQARGAQVYVFGSRARGSHRKFSDLDLLYSAPSELPLAFIYQIKSAIEESHISVKVDLVDEKDLADSFRAQVLKERVLV